MAAHCPRNSAQGVAADLVTAPVITKYRTETVDGEAAAVGLPRADPRTGTGHGDQAGRRLDQRQRPVQFAEPVQARLHPGRQPAILGLQAAGNGNQMTGARPSIAQGGGGGGADQIAAAPAQAGLLRPTAAQHRAVDCDEQGVAFRPARIQRQQATVVVGEVHRSGVLPDTLVPAKWKAGLQSAGTDS